MMFIFIKFIRLNKLLGVLNLLKILDIFFNFLFIILNNFSISKLDVQVKIME